MKKREINKTIILEPAKTRLENNQCPSCGLPKEKWKRRKDWRCCSIECTADFQKYAIYYGWQDFRERALKRDNYTCVKCGDDRKEVVVEVKSKSITNLEDCTKPNWKPEYKNFIRKDVRTNLIGDHIIPIALGGEEFDLNNVQTLCLTCNKIKTSKDLKNIAKQRRREKNPNQILIK